MLWNLSYLELSKTMSSIYCYKNIDLARKDMQAKWWYSGVTKNGEVLLFGGKRPYLKRIRDYDMGGGWWK